MLACICNRQSWPPFLSTARASIYRRAWARGCIDAVAGDATDSTPPLHIADTLMVDVIHETFPICRDMHDA